MLLTLPFLVVVGILLPLLGWLGLRHARTTRDDERPTASVRDMVVQLGMVQTVVVGLALVALYGATMEVSWRSDISLGTVSFAVLVLAAVLILALLEARKPLGPNDGVRAELRKVAATDPAWIGVTVYAGIIEEFVYRGVLILLLAQFVDYWPAAVLSAALFGLAHSASGWRAAASGVLFALGMQLLVFLSGGLALAVVVHVVYDLIAAWLGRRIEVGSS